MASSSSLETNAVRSRFQYSANEYNSSSSSSTANYAPCSTSTQPITKPMPPYAPPDLNELASTPLSQPHQLLDDNSGMSPAQSALNTAPNTGQPLTAVATSVATSFSSLSPQQQAPTSFQYTNNNYANNTSNSYNNNINKPASAHSIGATSFNHASSSPSPTYPSANSWPGFMAKNPVTDDSRLASFSCCSEPTKSSFAQHQQQPEQSVNGFKSFQRKSVDRVFVFNSKMANEAIGGVQENKYESIVAWHEANCQPSTSTAPQQNQFILNDSQPQQQPQPIKTKRKSNQEMRLRSPSSTNGIAPPPPVSGMSVTSSNSPISSRPESSTGSRNIDSSRFISPSNYEQLSEKNNPPTSSSDLLMPNDDIDINSDNPLRRMERMTQDSLFEPPSKVIRTTSNENSHPARRDQERNAKLEKMRTLEQQILIDKARSEWDRMVHEHEAIKMAQNGCVAAVAYQQQMIQRQHRAAPPIAAYPQPPLPSPVSSQYPVAQPHMIGPPAVAAAAPPPHMQHPAYRRPSYPPQQIPPSQGLSPIAPQNGSTAAMMNGGGIPVSAPPGMPMSQPLRPSLNPPPYSLHLPPDGGYMSCGGYPSNVAIPSQGYPPPPANMSSPTVSPAYSPMYPPMNPNPMPPRGYPVYPQQGMRPVYADKMMAPEMWPQQFPQPLGNLEARIPSQKIQYHPNGTVLDDGMGENIVNMNQMYG